MSLVKENKVPIDQESSIASKTIQLRIIGFYEDHQYRFICLDTDIAVADQTLSVAEQKMKDAILCYFESFTLKEILNGQYLRLAPIGYRIRWYIVPLLNRVSWLISQIANYDPKSKKLKFA